MQNNKDDIFSKYAKLNNFTFTPVFYDSGVYMFEALANGEVDAAVQTNFYDTPKGVVISPALNIPTGVTI